MLRHRRLLIALIVVIVGVLAGVAWLVWPEPPPKNLTLRLKFLRSEIVNGETKLRFKVERADKYEIMLDRFFYLNANDLPRLRPLSYDHVTRSSNGSREFYADPPRDEPYPAEPYSPDNSAGFKLQADVCLLVHEKASIRLYAAIKEAWQFHEQGPRPMFSTAKSVWRVNAIRVISQQVITSDVITNTPPQ